MTQLGDRSTDFSDVGTGTISDDDSATFTIDDSIVNEGDGSATFDISLDSPIDINLTIETNYTNGIAMGSAGGVGADFDNTNDQVIFASGSTSTQSVTVAITDDAISEFDEDFTASLTTTTLFGDRDITLSDDAIGTIQDNDTAAVLTIDDVTEIEGTGLLFTVTLSDDVESGFTVDIGYSGSEPTGGLALMYPTDYDNSPVTLTFVGNQNETQQFTVNTTNDGVVEPDETFVLAMTASSGLVDDSDTAIGTIEDNDTLSVEFSQSVGDDVEASGGNLPQLLVSGQVQAGHSLNIDVSVTGGTASAADYTAPTTLNVGGGTYASTAFAIPSLQVVDDAIVEPNETITLGNIAGVDVTLGTQTSTSYTILDDDTLSVEFSQSVGDDVEASGGNLPQLLVSGEVQAGHSVNIDVSVTGGTASATDYRRTDDA